MLIAIVYHSGFGHTRALAEAVAEGARSEAGMEVELVEATQERWELLARADAIVFGAPTYMGSVSAPFKAFMDKTSRIWLSQGWRDKLAAGFTTSSAPSGDKLNTLVQLAVFAAQHGMIWISLGLLAPTLRDGGDDLNRLGGHLGAMAQSLRGAELLPDADRRTGEHLGRRVAEAVRRWRHGSAHAPSSQRFVHPASLGWVLPPEQRPELPHPRTNLRALAARPGRFEHHLMVVARAGGAQLEIATASEPLYFAHANISDEYALTLPTGDPLLDDAPLRTFFSEPSTGKDVARVRHHAGDLLLHPYGTLHWPGRLRPPYLPFDFGPLGRRALLSLVYCGSRPAPPDAARPLVDRADAFKGSADLPRHLLDTQTAPAGLVGVVADTRLSLVVEPRQIAPTLGGYVVVLAGRAPHFPGDLIHVAPGTTLSGHGIDRALVFASESAVAQPPPESWQVPPPAPFAPYEDGPSLPLPARLGELTFSATDEVNVIVTRGEQRSQPIPRYWLARFLFRLALHEFRMGYLETYGGFWYDDRAGTCRFGFRGGPCVELSRALAKAAVEALYRAVAPPGYVERLT